MTEHAPSYSWGYTYFSVC